MQLYVNFLRSFVFPGLCHSNLALHCITILHYNMCLFILPIGKVLCVICVYNYLTIGMCVVSQCRLHKAVKSEGSNDSRTFPAF